MYERTSIIKKKVINYILSLFFLGIVSFSQLPYMVSVEVTESFSTEIISEKTSMESSDSIPNEQRVEPADQGDNF